MSKLASLTYEELDSLSLEEKTELLQQEFDMFEINSTILFDIDNIADNKITIFLESVMNAESNYQITLGGEYPAKSVVDILEHSKIEKDEFLFLLKILYLNGYIEHFKSQEFEIDIESKDVIYDNYLGIDPTHQLRYNLHRLYKTNLDLFNSERYYELENIGSEVEMYYKFLKRGTIVDMICSDLTLVRLSNKGMHYLHFVTSKRSIELMNKHKETLKEISKAKDKQSRLLKTFEQHKLQQDKSMMSFETLIGKHSEKVKDFYKDITTILSIMVAAFAVIGVNISAIPKIESNFTANLFAMNLSLILCLLVLFYILRVLVYDDKINSKHFFSLLTTTILCIIGVFLFLGFNHESKIDVIENKYQKMINNYTIKNEEDISLLENKIEQLEKQIKK